MNKNSTPRKVSKTSPRVANPAGITEKHPVTVVEAAVTVAEETVANDKCLLPFVLPVALKLKCPSSQIRQNRSIAVTASKNHATVELNFRVEFLRPQLEKAGVFLYGDFLNKRQEEFVLEKKLNPKAFGLIGL